MATVPFDWDDDNDLGSPLLDEDEKQPLVSLLVRRKGHPVESFPLFEGNAVIGRGEDVDVTISCPTVSRRHAEVSVVYRNGIVTIKLRDLGSTSRTKIEYLYKDSMFLPQNVWRVISEKEKVFMGSALCTFEIVDRAHRASSPLPSAPGGRQVERVFPHPDGKTLVREVIMEDENPFEEDDFPATVPYDEDKDNTFNILSDIRGAGKKELKGSIHDDDTQRHSSDEECDMDEISATIPYRDDSSDEETATMSSTTRDDADSIAETVPYDDDAPTQPCIDDDDENSLKAQGKRSQDAGTIEATVAYDDDDDDDDDDTERILDQYTTVDATVKYHDDIDDNDDDYDDYNRETDDESGGRDTVDATVAYGEDDKSDDEHDGRSGKGTALATVVYDGPQLYDDNGGGENRSNKGENISNPDFGARQVHEGDQNDSEGSLTFDFGIGEDNHTAEDEQADNREEDGTQPKEKEGEEERDTEFRGRRKREKKEREAEDKARNANEENKGKESVERIEKECKEKNEKDRRKKEENARDQEESERKEKEERKGKAQREQEEKDRRNREERAGKEKDDRERKAKEERNEKERMEEEKEARKENKERARKENEEQERKERDEKERKEKDLQERMEIEERQQKEKEERVQKEQKETEEKEKLEAIERERKARKEEEEQQRKEKMRKEKEKVEQEEENEKEKMEQEQEKEREDQKRKDKEDKETEYAQSCATGSMNEDERERLRLEDRTIDEERPEVLRRSGSLRRRTAAKRKEEENEGQKEEEQERVSRRGRRRRAVVLSESSDMDVPAADDDTNEETKGAKRTTLNSKKVAQYEAETDDEEEDTEEAGQEVVRPISTRTRRVRQEKAHESKEEKNFSPEKDLDRRSKRGRGKGAVAKREEEERSSKRRRKRGKEQQKGETGEAEKREETLPSITSKRKRAAVKESNGDDKNEEKGESLQGGRKRRRGSFNDASGKQEADKSIQQDVDMTEDEDSSSIAEDVVGKPRKRRIAIHHVMFTGFSGAQLKKMEKMVSDLGGVVLPDSINKIKDCNVLISEKVLRTPKFLCAIGVGAHIVPSKWLTTSKKAGQFEDVNDYLLCDRAQEKKWKFKLKDSLDKAASSGGVLKGYRVFITPHAETDSKKMRDIVENNGGTLVTSVPANQEHLLVIASVADAKTPSKWKLKGETKCFTPELILSGVLQQKLDFDAHTIGDEASSSALSRRRR